MEFSLRAFCMVLLVALHSPCKVTQSPADLPSLSFTQPTANASTDFGRMVFHSPSIVLRPRSPTDLSLLLGSLSASPSATFTVAARGAGHSIHGQAQALDGILVEMDSLPKTIEIKNSDGGPSYADVGGGVLWVELLEESLRHGLAPRSWTDYLHLSVGGTLSVGGISGQTFKHGPQISNVLQLDVVTVNGELLTCSPAKNSELFHAALGGLGQFGIITSARILLQEAPQKVRWVRAFYGDLEAFTSDQELLVSMPEKVDYVEGFLVLNEQSLHSSSIAFPSPHADFARVLRSGTGPELHYCLEFAIHVHHDRASEVDLALEEITGMLSYIAPYIYVAEVSYYDFLNRVRLEEMSLRSEGAWDVPHPWLNMFVPKNGIHGFVDLLMESISAAQFTGPVLIYPFLKDKWDSNTSAVLPDSPSNVTYIVGILRSAAPSSCSPQCLRDILEGNQRIVRASTLSGHIGAKQYLAHHEHEEDWRRHFGAKWELFSSRKARFDPLCVLSPGQNICRRKRLDHASFLRSSQ